MLGGALRRVGLGTRIELVGLFIAVWFLGSSLPASAVGGGTVVDAATFASDWSFTVGLTKAGDDYFTCTGTLVDASTVITAGHCDDATEGHIPDTVYYGSPDLLSGASHVAIASIERNPNYTTTPLISGDTAIVHLASPVTGVTPIRVATAAEEAELGSSVSARFAGYGLVGNGVDTTVLHAGTGSVTGDGSTWLLSGGTVMPCPGDSGGPLVATLPGGEDVLIGAVSYGDASCPGAFNVWTDLGQDGFVQNAINGAGGGAGGGGGGGATATLVQSVSPTTGTAPLDVAFDLTGSSISDGSDATYFVYPTNDPNDYVSSTTPVLHFTYTQDGTYTAEVGVSETGSPNVQDVALVTITVGTPPTATLVQSVSPTTGAAPLDVTFDVTGSGISDGRDATYFVYPTDDPNDEITSTTPVMHFTYTQSGTYTAEVGLYDVKSDLQTSALVTITVEGGGGGSPPATAILVQSVSPTTGPAPLTVSFDLTGSHISDGRDAVYLVDPTFDPNALDFSPNVVSSPTPVVTTFTYTQPGTYTALVGLYDPNSDPNDPSTYISDSALVTITVTEPAADTTPPAVTITASPTDPSASGWYNAWLLGAEDGLPVGVAADDGSDGSGVASIDCAVDGGPVQSSATSPFALGSLQEGIHDVSCTATDDKGNTSQPATATYKIDTSGPTITGAGKNADGSSYAAGSWTNQDVTVHFSCDDHGLSGVATCEPGTDPMFTGSTSSVAASATDNAGNGSTGSFGPIEIDKIDPTITASATNADGSDYTAGSWTNQAVTVRYDCADTGGSALAGCTPDQPFTTGGTTASTSGTASDNAGNSASASFGPIMIDTAPPTLTFSDCPTGTVVTGSSVNVHWQAADGSGSGVVGADHGSFTLDTSVIGGGSVTEPAATDHAGNTGTAATCSYVVGYQFLPGPSGTGFFAPAPQSKAKLGQTVPIKVALADSAGQPVQACSGCSVLFQATPGPNGSGQAIGPTPMKYDATKQQYVYDWKLRTTGTGLSNLSITVTYPNTTGQTTKTEQIAITG